MNIFLFDRPTYELKYNCSFYDVNQIPLADREHPIIGSIFTVTATLMILLYIPCLVVFCRKRFRRQPCYKIMIFLGIIDVLLTIGNGVISGIFVIFGTVYCEHPLIIYYIGSFGQGMWCGQSVALVFLALNRCLEMARSPLSDILFDKNRVYIWIGIAIVYFLIVSFYETAFIFSAIHMTWQTNPHAGYFDDVESRYHNSTHMPNNLFVIVAMTSIYTIFAVIFYKKTSGITNRKHVKQTFIQVFLLCVATVILCAAYIIIQFIKLPTVVTMVIQFIWICNCGLPPIIYLTLNSTVRKNLNSLIRCNGFVTSSINDQSHLHNNAKRSSHSSVVRPNQVDSSY